LVASRLIPWHVHEKVYCYYQSQEPENLLSSDQVGAPLELR